MATIAECARNEMLRTEREVIWAGEPDLCLAAYELSGGRVIHPLDRIQAVINAVRKSPMFKQDGYIRACDSGGRREVLHPVFMLVDSDCVPTT